MTSAGKFIKQLKGYRAFIPKPLPPDPAVVLDSEAQSLLEKAGKSLGKLGGLAAKFPDKDLFVYLFVRKEALLSSQIEGTQCSLEDVLDPQKFSSKSDADVEEVSNYVKAMSEGLKRLEKLPVSSRLVKEFHATLMKGVRDSNKTPGEFRRSQNWIGRPGSTLKNAEFVPPPPEEVDQHMGELEKFIHSDVEMPDLVKAALVHSQFETIHPFLDGNGRLGRLLITFLLCHWGLLEEPLLYLSYYFKSNRSEYYKRLMDVRLKGDFDSWIKFFLKAVLESAEIACSAAIEISDLHERDRKKLAKMEVNQSALRAFEFFCKEPLLSNAHLVKRMKSTKPTVQKTIGALEKAKLIVEKSGKQRGRVYVYEQYLQILTRDTTLRME